MKVYEVQVCRWNDCPHQRQYRTVGTVLADDTWEALNKAQEKYADAPDPNENEPLCLGPIGTERTPTRFERIDGG